MSEEAHDTRVLPQRPRVDIGQLLRDANNQDTYLKVQAPMVRYSRLPFRDLCRAYGCDIGFTPMLIAESFQESQRARDADFRTSSVDTPLVIQFASNDALELGRAAQMCRGYVDAVDINCGCPQKWVMKEGWGAALIGKEDLLRDMVRSVREQSGLPVSVKIRVHDDLRQTVDLARKVESVGVEWISVHGRTIKERTAVPVSTSAIKLVRESVSVPVVANGDAVSLSEADRIYRETGAHGVMSARGLLRNPALFTGVDDTPNQCVKDYLDLSVAYGESFHIMHQHLMFMMSDKLNRLDKRIFNRATSLAEVVQLLREYNVV